MAARAVEVRRRKTGTAAALVSAGGRGRASGWAELGRGGGWLGPAGRPRPGRGGKEVARLGRGVLSGRKVGRAKSKERIKEFPN
jgi:hypothetical protein